MLLKKPPEFWTNKPLGNPGRFKPVVRFVPAQSKGPAFRIGIAEGEVTQIPDFLKPIADDEIALWT